MIGSEGVTMSDILTSPGGGAADSPLTDEILSRCVRSAVAAPSLHNSQPWLFRIADGGVDVYADRSRRLDVLDPAGRASC
jgi:nitroreductase